MRFAIRRMNCNVNVNGRVTISNRVVNERYTQNVRPTARDVAILNKDVGRYSNDAVDSGRYLMRLTVRRVNCHMDVSHGYSASNRVLN